ncbi:unnamed protein product, partial [Linum tenue]
PIDFCRFLSRPSLPQPSPPIALRLFLSRPTLPHPSLSSVKDEESEVRGTTVARDHFDKILFVIQISMEDQIELILCHG